MPVVEGMREKRGLGFKLENLTKFRTGSYNSIRADIRLPETPSPFRVWSDRGPDPHVTLSVLGYISLITNGLRGDSRENPRKTRVFEGATYRFTGRSESVAGGTGRVSPAKLARLGTGTQTGFRSFLYRPNLC